MGRLKPTPLFFMPMPTLPMPTMAMDMAWEATMVLDTMDLQLDTMAMELDTTVLELRALPVLTPPTYPFPALLAVNVVRPKPKLTPLSSMEVTMVDIPMDMALTDTDMVWVDTMVDTTESILLTTESATTTLELVSPANMSKSKITANIMS